MVSPSNYILEACVESADQAIRAEQNGAHRIELCSDLFAGGLFPGKSLLRYVIQQVSIPICVMIRPGPGNFEYNSVELSTMKDQINICRDHGVFGVVFGVSKAGRLDLETLQMLINFSKELSITIHKVVDIVGDPVHNINQLTHITGIDRVLSSGGKQTVLEGSSVIKQMMETAGNHFNIMPGGNITKSNIKRIHTYLQAQEYHGRQIV